MRDTLRLLVVLSVAVQAWVLYALRFELGAGLFAPPDLLLLLSPAILGLGGAAAAAWLRRRGVRWAPVVAWVPLVLLGLALLLAVLLWFNPIRHQP